MSTNDISFKIDASGAAQIICSMSHGTFPANCIWWSINCLVCHITGRLSTLLGLGWIFSSLRAKINDARWYIRARILKGTRIMAVFSRGKLSRDICVFQVDRNNVNCRYWQIMTFFFKARLLVALLSSCNRRTSSFTLPRSFYPFSALWAQQMLDPPLFLSFDHRLQQPCKFGNRKLNLPCELFLSL